MGPGNDREVAHTLGDLLQRVTAVEALLERGRFDAPLRGAVTDLFAEIDALADRLDAIAPETATRLAALVGRASLLKQRLSRLRQ